MPSTPVPASWAARRRYAPGEWRPTGTAGKTASAHFGFSTISASGPQGPNPLSASGLPRISGEKYLGEPTRWLSRDPIGEAGGINIYSYALRNPIGNVDPLGRICVTDPSSPYGKYCITFGTFTGAPPIGYSGPEIPLNKFTPGRFPYPYDSGKIYDDLEGGNTEATCEKRRYPSGPTIDAQIKAGMVSRLGNMAPYSLFTNSCRTFSNNLLDYYRDKFNLKRPPTIPYYYGGKCRGK
jgi:RHS repeat-associated protein